MTELTRKLQMVDSLIKSAQISQARHEFLNLLKTLKWQRKDLAALCQMARRLQLPYLIIRWLHPLIRSEKLNAEKPSIEETALYAAALTRIGAFTEAESLLKSVSSDKFHDIHFFLGLLYIAQWDYQRAIRPLKRYIQSQEPFSYQYILGQVNLAAALVATGQSEKAADLMAELLQNSAQNQPALMRANLFEVSAQNALNQNDHSAAERYLDEAQRLLEGNSSNYALFVSKWRLILKMLKSPQQSWDADCASLKAQAGRFRRTEPVNFIERIHPISWIGAT